MRDFISFRQEQEHNDATGNSRWMVSYADFMTLLFVLFLVLFLVSLVAGLVRRV